MQPGTSILLAKAERAAAAAATALAAGAPEMAASRAFGAMLHAAKAVLSERGLRLRTHARIVAAFRRTVPVTNPPMADWLAECVARRHAAAAEDITFDEAAELVARAGVFVAAAGNCIAARV